MFAVEMRLSTEQPSSRRTETLLRHRIARQTQRWICTLAEASTAESKARYPSHSFEEVGIERVEWNLPFNILTVFDLYHPYQQESDFTASSAKWRTLKSRLQLASVGVGIAILG